MKNGIKVLLFITCILFLKFFSTFFINQIIIKDYYQQKPKLKVMRKKVRLLLITIQKKI